MEQKFIQGQNQKLVLSPQIRQYLRMLQMPIADLMLAIDQELSENPVLETDDEVPNPEASETDSTSEAKHSTETDELQFDETSKRLDQMEQLFSEDEFRQGNDNWDEPQNLQKKKDFQESLVSYSQNLGDYLQWQVTMMEISEIEKKIADEIVGNIDDDGFLVASAEEVSQKLNVSCAQVEGVLKKIQELDPPGIGARSLQEALLIQALQKDSKNKIAIDIIQNHLHPLERKQFAEVAKHLNVSQDEIKRAAAFIGRLEPHPGRIFSSESANTVIPDAQISLDLDGKLQIEMLDEVLPRLRISRYYRQLLRSGKVDEKTKLFLKEKMQSALEFLRAIGQRKSTLHEITEHISRSQPDFFEKGFSHLRPLRLKDIANEIGIHESTVSRAIQGKYMTTPQGTIAYKSFFSSKILSLTGEAESQKSMVEKIRQLIEKEDPAKPLSDEKIVQILKADGMVIARRTVTKYREILRILPSHLRKQK